MRPLSTVTVGVGGALVFNTVCIVLYCIVLLYYCITLIQRIKYGL